jgi:hypothetical protein
MAPDCHWKYVNPKRGTRGMAMLSQEFLKVLRGEVVFPDFRVDAIVK